MTTPGRPTAFKKVFNASPGRPAASASSMGGHGLGKPPAGVDHQRSLVEGELRHRNASRGCVEREHCPRRDAEDERRAAGCADHRREVLDSAVHRVRLPRAAVPSPPAVVGEDRETAASSAATLGMGPNVRVQSAPSTRTTGGPSPTRLNAIGVPSLEVTFWMLMQGWTRAGPEKIRPLRHAPVSFWPPRGSFRHEHRSP